MAIIKCKECGKEFSNKANVINLRIEINKFYSFFDIIIMNKRW